MLILALFLSLGVAAPSASAADATAGAGYVVRADSGSVYLDLGAGSGAQAGQMFRVYTLGPELIHPVTGKDLGPIKNFVAEGRITDVETLYSQGTLTDPSKTAAPGMRVELEAAAPSVMPTPEASPTSAQTPSAADLNRRPRWKSPWFNFPINALAIGDFSGDGGSQIALASQHAVSLYPYPPTDVKPLAQFIIPGALVRVVSMEADSQSGDQKARLLVSFYDDALNRMETDVLVVSSNALVREQNFPWMVRAYQQTSGAYVLAAQQLLDDATFPFSPIYPLTQAQEHYSPSEKPLHDLGSDWLYNFTQASLDGQDATLSVTDTHRLLAKTEDQKWESEDPFGQTPVRLRWHEQVLEFSPPMPVVYNSGKASIYLASNESRFGALSQAFGIFESAKLERETWRDASFSTDWQADIPGYVTDLAVVGNSSAPKDLAVAMSTRAGKSSLWIYDP